MRCSFCGSENIEHDETIQPLIVGGIRQMDGIQIRCNDCQVEYVRNRHNYNIISVYHKSKIIKDLPIINEKSLREGFEIMYEDEEDQ